MTAVTYHTESGDRGFVGVFSREPTEEELATIAEQDYTEEWECNCIYFETYPVPEGVQELL